MWILTGIILIIVWFVIKYVSFVLFLKIGIALIKEAIKEGAEQINEKLSGMPSMQTNDRQQGNKTSSEQQELHRDAEKNQKQGGT